MKKPADGTSAGDTQRQTLRAADAIAFRIVAFNRVRYGSKTAEFSIETPFGIVEADLFEPQGRDPFVQARSVRDKFTGQWRRTVALDRTFAARVLAALHEPSSTSIHRPARKESQGVEPRVALLESERRFDAAFVALDRGKGAS